MSPDPSLDLPNELWLGPYRVLGPIGRGGMGEVVLAEDPRLKRRVAIKRLLSDPSEGEDPKRAAARRARFQREARMLARLRHPAIVKIFELLSVDGKDHLVMEHIEGSDLRQLLKAEGALSGEEVVEVALPLAEALEHAHLHGIIHRDLKAENVLIDADGKPHLADFGLARKTGRALTESDVLTAEGHILGTARAMAPEQIRGVSLDGRADLFALGVLMAEMLTGRSPFEGPNRQDTLIRVLTEPPPTLEDTGTSIELCQLIAHLLEKEPALRPRSAGEVAARLVRIAENSGATEYMEGLLDPEQSPSPRSPHRLWIGTAIAGLFMIAVFGWMLLNRASVSRTLQVAVVATKVNGPDAEEADILGFAVRSAILRAFSGLDRVVASRAAEVDAMADELTPRELARVTASEQVLTSEVRCDAMECWLELARIDGETGEMLWGASLQTLRAEPATLAWAVEESVIDGFPERLLAEQQAMPPELLAELLPLRLVDGQSAAGLDPRAAFDRLDALRDRFGAHPELDLWRARVASTVFARSREREWLDRVFLALDAAAESSPDDPQILLVRAEAQLIAGLLDEVTITLDAIENEIPGDVRVDEIRARLWAAEGRAPLALETMQKIVNRRPSWMRIFNLARMASQVGEIELAFSTLDRLESHASGNPHGMRLRASLELRYGSLDHAAEVYETLAEASPDVAAWTNLGIAHMLRRDAPKALAALTYAKRLEPNNPLVLLNLADAHSLAGSSEATALYASVVDRLEGAPPTDLQAMTARAQAQARLGRAPEAIADIENAIRLGPDNVSARFEASLVYALLGDLASARRNRNRALELGLEERWFSLQPFDVLE